MPSPKQLEQYSFQPKERAAAKALGLTTYFTGRPCKHGHIANRVTSSGSCVICANATEKKSRLKAFEADSDLYKKRYSKNKELYRLKAAEYRAANPDKIKESNRKSRILHRARNTALERARQAAKKGATPAWLTDEHKRQIKATYEMAAKTSKLAGFKCHVDHIVPLNGKIVSGLHVPWNLRVVSQSYNSKKKNVLDDGILFAPTMRGVLIHSSALPWNWSKL